MIQKHWVSVGYHDGSGWKRLTRYTIDGDDREELQARLDEAIELYEDLLNGKRQHMRVSEDTPIRVSQFTHRFMNSKNELSELVRVGGLVKTRTEIRPPKTIREHQELGMFV